LSSSVQVYKQTKKFKEKENVTYHYIRSKGIRMSTQRCYPFEEAKKMDSISLKVPLLYQIT